MCRKSSPFVEQNEAKSHDMMRVKNVCSFVRKDIQMAIIPIMVKNK